MKKLVLYFFISSLGITIILTNYTKQAPFNFDRVYDAAKASQYQAGSYQKIFFDRKAGFNFTENIIIENFDCPNTIAAADLDADGDMDVVATSFDGSYVSWLENDGNQNFTEHKIIENFGKPRADVAHLDGDLDFDIIAASQAGDKISWFENDGNGNFTEHVIVDNWESAGIVYARDQQRGFDLDINKDGYTDFIATSPNPGNKISWFENDGTQNFTEHVLKENWYWVRRASAYDIDKDSDMDIFAAAKDGKLIWFENDGEENFSEHIIISEWGEPNAILAEDINKDGFIDLAATSVVANEVVWFENEGSQNFTKHVIKDQFNGAYGLDVTDIDNDNDIDIIATAWISGTGSVFVNDGEQNFTEHVFCDNGLEFLHLFITDLDNDNDKDILGVFYAPNIPQIRWWENDLIAGVKENNSPPQDFQLKQNYPNPFNPSTTITYQIPQSYFVSLKVYDTLGNAVAVLVNGEKPKGIYHVTFNATNLASGVYVYQLKAYKKGNMTDDFIKTRKMILLK